MQRRMEAGGYPWPVHVNGSGEANTIMHSLIAASSSEQQAGCLVKKILFWARQQEK